MYQKNLKTYFNQNYGPGKRSLNGHQSTAAVRQNKKMLEEDSGAEDDFAPYKAREKEGFLNEKNVGSVMFLVTISVLLAKLYEMFNSTIHLSLPSDWYSSVQFPKLQMNWHPQIQENIQRASPLLWSIGCAALSAILIYFDSKVPGINPKFPTSRELFNPLRWNFAYWTALFGGVFVFFTLTILDL